MTINDVSSEFDVLENTKIYHFEYKPLKNDIDDVLFPIELYFTGILRGIDDLVEESIETHRDTLEALAR